jgi:hypothetical protein
VRTFSCIVHHLFFSCVFLPDARCAPAPPRPSVIPLYRQIDHHVCFIQVIFSPSPLLPSLRRVGPRARVRDLRSPLSAGRCLPLPLALRLLCPYLSARGWTPCSVRCPRARARARGMRYAKSLLLLTARAHARSSPCHCVTVHPNTSLVTEPTRSSDPSTALSRRERHTPRKERSGEERLVYREKTPRAATGWPRGKTEIV